MIEDTKNQLIVDSQDLICQTCFAPFIKQCAFHEKYLEGLWLETGKSVCFECLADKFAIISLKEVEEKVDQLKETQEKYKAQVEKFLKTEQEEFKKRIDNIFSQEVCYTPLLKERLYKEIQGFTNGFERRYDNKSVLLEKIEDIEIMLEKLRISDNHEVDNELAKEIIETKLDWDFYMEDFEKITIKLRKELAEKQNKLLEEIHNNQTLVKCLSRKIKRVLERPPYMLLDSIPVDLELQYLVEMCEGFNLIATENISCRSLVLKDCRKINWKIIFNAIFFDCRIKVLEVGCMYSLNFLQTIAIFGGILENLSNLESFTITLFKISEMELGFLENSISQLKKLKEFSIRVNRLNDAKPLLATFCEESRSLSWFSRFEIQLESGSFYDTIRAKLRKSFELFIERRSLIKYAE